ncbi:hypothetical protein KP79_PYT23837 [Mizuhopecten yessoensis]|uniref:Uncharacterized protein n=1 Tax=Mizuhopecten yessoensis TaxID=6573 RepID=A0A210R4D6_MIZYE|nr:hypothetical protein KP79_PYT23837 [Mizuhopecten yessoensis]
MCRNILLMLPGTVADHPHSACLLSMQGHAVYSDPSWLMNLKFFGELGHTFMEFVTNSGDYCQAQHAL